MPSLTSVPGLRLGHATDAAARTGCTVVLGPFRASCDVRGLATGTRELDALQPHHLVPTVNAILLTGGSAFGLDAAGGVMGCKVVMAGGSEVRMEAIRLALVLPVNAARPVAAS